MNTIEIFAPRWRDRTVLVADWKIGMRNTIDITCRKADGSRRYPEPFVVDGAWLKSFPTEQVKGRTIRRVDLDKLLEKCYPQEQPTDKLKLKDLKQSNLFEMLGDK